MAVSLDTFRALAEASRFSSRDIVVEGEGKKQEARLGNLVFSAGRQVNDDTMKAFKAALESEWGVFGTHAFDTVLGTRQQLGKSLRAGDVTQTLSRLETIRKQHLIGELERQFDTNPMVRELPGDVQNEVRRLITEHPLGNPPASLKDCKSQDSLNLIASSIMDKAVEEAKRNLAGGAGAPNALGSRGKEKPPVAPDDPVGLRNLTAAVTFSHDATSVEDRVKAGTIGAGMRVNRSETNPVLLEKLKTNGVEPGFIARNDWSLDDTRGMMADIWDKKNLDELSDLVLRCPALKARRDGQPPASVRELAMLAGRAHPAGVAAVAEFVLERGLADPDSAIAKAFARKFPDYDPSVVFPEDGGKPTAAQRKVIADAKRALFVEIRDAVMNESPKSPDYGKSPIFKHFKDRSIVKLDYNEGDKHFWRSAGSGGHLRLPVRVSIKNGAFQGFIYRNFRMTKANKASAGAVKEALANDITRLLGVPAQELSLVRGEYSDGKPKLMLSAKFAEGYHDLEDGYLKDGHAVPLLGEKALEPLGRYKALFLALADRDAVGSHGQNKGIIGNRFFAIDPGHSLEGNGKDLEIHDDFSFIDHGASRFEKRFLNFRVFDDDTRFHKFEGVLKLRELSLSPKLSALFADYKAKFNPEEKGIGPAEKELRSIIIDGVKQMEDEFRTQIRGMLKVFSSQLAVYDSLAPYPPTDNPTSDQINAIETIENLEKLTSPTTWKSANGTVDLEHLSVVPQTRVPWQASVNEAGDITYSTKAPLSQKAKERLDTFCANAGVQAMATLDGGTSITVSRLHRAAFFDAFQENNVIDEKHADEYAPRIARATERAHLAAELELRRALEQQAGQETGNNPPAPAAPVADPVTQRAAAAGSAAADEFIASHGLMDELDADEFIAAQTGETV